MDRFTSFDGVEIAYQTWGTVGDRRVSRVVAQGELLLLVP